MKVRCVTFGLYVSPEDFLQSEQLEKKFEKVAEILTNLVTELKSELDHEVQTTRVSLNSFEEWLMPLIKSHGMSVEAVITMLAEQLTRHKMQFCNIGYSTTADTAAMLPHILSLCNNISGSVLFRKQSEGDIAPNYDMCKIAAKVCLDLVNSCGELGNFRFCASFNCHAGTPFYPVSYHEGEQSSVSVGMENGDLLFLGFFGVTSHETARNNLTDIMKQVYTPIQALVQSVCDKHDVLYAGIDASINPGLTIPDSIGLGLENLIYPFSIDPSTRVTHFGSMGTLAAVSTVTSAVKGLVNHGIKLVGYNGLMLPVMEDLRLAELASGLNKGRHVGDTSTSITPAFSLRDLLTFSSVCGVGLDTVPIPGSTSVEELAGVYMEVGAMAFRLNKPLTCRLLPMTGKVAGDTTEVDSPYLCNTKVFAINL